MLQIPITEFEKKIISQLKDKYQISDREIFEIICHCGCQDDIIIAYIKRGRQRYQVTKEVQIPRKILTKKKT